MQHYSAFFSQTKHFKVQEKQKQEQDFRDGGDKERLELPCGICVVAVIPQVSCTPNDFTKLLFASHSGLHAYRHQLGLSLTCLTKLQVHSDFFFFPTEMGN